MTRPLSSRRRLSSRPGRRDEGGLALITALLVMMVATGLVIASVALATHTEGQSADQRNQTAALHGAEYGLQEELASLAASPSGGGLVPPSCTPIPSAVLPNTSLPAQWFSVSLPGCSTTSLVRTIIATGYALGAGSSPPSTPPAGAAQRTVVAHVTLQPAGAISNGGYGFPDVITALKGSDNGQTGAIATTGGPLSVSGLGGNPVSIRADGPVSLSGGTLTLTSAQITNSLSSWDNVTLSGTTVTGNVASAKTVTLTSANVTGNVIGTTVAKDSGSTVTGAVRNQTPTLPSQPPVPSFPSPADPGWANWLALTGAAAVSTNCPAPGGTLTGTYVLSNSCTLAPSALSGSVAVIAKDDSALTVNLPAFLGSGPSQLYLVVTEGNLTLTGQGAAVPVFAYGSGRVTVGGTIVGQLVGGNIVTSASTQLIGESVSTTVSGTPTFPPDFAFPNFTGSGAPPPGFVPQISDEYLCAPGATAAC